MATKRFGKATKSCKICGTHNRLVGAYNLNICGRCFREVALKLGFKKYS